MDENLINILLEKANELGLLIQDTEVYRAYKESMECLEMDSLGSEQLAYFEAACANLEAKQKSGITIDPSEIESLQEMISVLEEHHPLIMDHLTAKSKYIELLETVRKALLEG